MLYNQAMEFLSEKKAIEKAENLLSTWFDCEPGQIIYKPELGDNQFSKYVVDAVIHINDIFFLIEYKKAGDLGYVMKGIGQLNKFEINKENIVKILVVPYMYKLGRKKCEEAKVSWLDLSGNANIKGPNIRIIIDNQSNLFKRPGRSTSVFAPKSSRVTRFLLYNSQGAFSQREISLQTDLDEGYVSRIVGSLQELELVTKDDSGNITNRNPETLLDAWLEKYDLSKHNVIKGYIPARSGQLLMQHINNFLKKEGINFAITGLSAAWLYNHFASFRTVTVYSEKSVSSELLSNLDFSESDIGYNTIIASPNDTSVLWNLSEIEDIKCVHPIQAYLDLKGQPERSQEAMSQLKSFLLESYFK